MKVCIPGKEARTEAKRVFQMQVETWMHTFMLQEVTAMIAIVKLHVTMRCVN